LWINRAGRPAGFLKGEKMMKHTPGPWKFFDSTPEEEEREIWYTTVLETLNDGGRWVYILAQCDLSELGDEAADYRLMAAAPDLLAACKVALDAVPEFVRVLPQLAGAVRDVLCAAIEAAEGAGDEDND
jgi:hypothetical protein